MQPTRMMLLAAALSTLLAGCATTVGGGTDLVCSQWRGISWSQRDTTETIDGVKANNARRQAWCRG